MDILNHWRQFSRRYFWLYSLLRMISASLVLPTRLNQSNEHTSASKNPVAFSLSEVVTLKEVHRRTSFGIDYCNEYAINTVICHLSFALTVLQVQSLVLPQLKAALSAYPLVILDTFDSLLRLPETKTLSALHSLLPGTEPLFLLPLLSVRGYGCPKSAASALVQHSLPWRRAGLLAFF
ncbi:MAG: hypothetical protein ACFC1C_04170 [Candidatus Malihini olakiniferum]